MMGIELSVSAGERRSVFSGAAVSASALSMRTAGPCRRAQRASARSAVAASHRTIGKTRAIARACLPETAGCAPAIWPRATALGLIRLVGRMKDVIKSGGYSVYVRELEEALLANPAVARAVAFGLPHKEKGEIPVAAVELQPGSARRMKTSCWIGAARILRPTKRRGESGFSNPAACRRITMASSFAGPPGAIFRVDALRAMVRFEIGSYLLTQQPGHTVAGSAAAVAAVTISRIESITSSGSSRWIQWALSVAMTCCTLIPDFVEALAGERRGFAGRQHQDRDLANRARCPASRARFQGRLRRGFASRRSIPAATSARRRRAKLLWASCPLLL